MYISPNKNKNTKTWDPMMMSPIKNTIPQSSISTNYPSHHVYHDHLDMRRKYMVPVAINHISEPRKPGTFLASASMDFSVASIGYLFY